MIKVMGFVLHAMLVINLTETEDASRDKLQLETLTAKHSRMEFVLNALKELFSICLEYASQLILHAKLLMKQMEDVLLVILDSNYLNRENVFRVQHLK